MQHEFIGRLSHLGGYHGKVNGLKGPCLIISYDALVHVVHDVRHSLLMWALKSLEKKTALVHRFISHTI